MVFAPLQMRDRGKRLISSVKIDRQEEKELFFGEGVLKQQRLHLFSASGDRFIPFR